MASEYGIIHKNSFNTTEYRQKNTGGRNHDSTGKGTQPVV